MAKKTRDARPERPIKEDQLRTRLLYHYSRIQLPGIQLGLEKFLSHLRRAFDLYLAKEPAIAWPEYLKSLHAADCFLAAGCLERDDRAWEYLFAARAGRADCLLVDALRARAVRLYPHDMERQESAVTEFWSQLLVADTPGATPKLARYDGQRPLIPWLIRIFQNENISHLRQRTNTRQLPEEELSLPLPVEADSRWHDAFCLAARDWLQELGEIDILILGLRLRYHLSQRQVAGILGVHEGTVSRQTTHLRDRCLEQIGKALADQGWAGDDLSAFVLNEMAAVLLDDPQLSADRLARILRTRGQKIPPVPPGDG